MAIILRVAAQPDDRLIVPAAAEHVDLGDIRSHHRIVPSKLFRAFADQMVPLAVINLRRLSRPATKADWLDDTPRR